MNTRQPSTITTAVFPVAGLGTRFLPATKAQPKEMLPVVDKPLIQYAVEEAYAAGIRHMVFVTGRNKRAIEDHFDTAYELEAELAANGKTKLMQLIHSIKPADMDCSYVRQSRSLGLGHAVLCAEQLVGAAPFAVLLADDLMVNQQAPNAQGITAQMVQLYEEVQTALLAVQQVPLERVSSYGIVVSHVVRDRLRKVDSIVEKPSADTAPSTLAVAGRYILTPTIFKHLRQQQPGANGEIQLTDAIAQLMRVEPVHAYEYIGKRYDCGSKEGFLEATVELALQHPEVAHSFQEFLRHLRD